MATGFPTTQGDINNRAGYLALQLRDVLDGIGNMQGWLGGQTEQDLTDRGFTTDEVAVLKSAFIDLDKVRLIYEGAATQPVTNDFRFWASRLIGIN